MPKPASTAAANYVEPDFKSYTEKAPTATQDHFHAWVLAKTGITFATKKEEAAFKAGIVIGTSLRGIHQASPENQERLAEQRAASAEAKSAKEAEAAANPAPAKAAKAAKATAPAVAPVEAAPPAAARPAVKRGRGRAAATAPATDTVAPF